MRLLKFDGLSELSLTKDLIEDIPSYAILSHTWGADGEEVTYEDLVKGNGKEKDKPGSFKGLDRAYFTKRGPIPVS